RRQGLSLIGGSATYALLASSQIVAAQQQPAGELSPFAHQSVVDRARALASAAYVEPAAALPEALGRLTYDQYRDIRYRPDQALLAEDPSGYRVQLFHLGFLFKIPVHINLVRNGKSARVAFSPAAFHYGANKFEEALPSDLGFAGLRVHF